jgi:hypothetical protein
MSEQADFARFLGRFAGVWQRSRYVSDVCRFFDFPRWMTYRIAREARRDGHYVPAMPWTKLSLKRFVKAWEGSESVADVARLLKISVRKACRLRNKARAHGVGLARLPRMLVPRFFVGRTLTLAVCGPVQSLVRKPVFLMN